MPQKYTAEEKSSIFVTGNEKQQWDRKIKVGV